MPSGAQILKMWSIWLEARTALFLYLPSMDFHDHAYRNEDLGEELKEQRNWHLYQ